MKKTFLIIATILFFLISNTISTFAHEAPDAYMGFSVPEQWYVFSKNMTDSALLDVVGLDADDVNQTLVNSDCEHLILNPENNSEIYVKIKKNEVAKELFNLSDIDDEFVLNNIDDILKNGFSVDGFSYEISEVQITPYSQMKFVAVPGTVMYDGASHGVIIGFTIVNGRGIVFILYLDKSVAEDEDLQAMTELASSLTFTVIRDKGTDVYLNVEEENIGDNVLAYIAGGFGGLALIALCLYFIRGIKKTESTVENEEDAKNETVN